MSDMQHPILVHNSGVDATAIPPFQVGKVRHRKEGLSPSLQLPPHMGDGHGSQLNPGTADSINHNPAFQLCCLGYTKHSIMKIFLPALYYPVVSAWSNHFHIAFQFTMLFGVCS